MTTRLRLAARDPEEMQQAAATQIAFDECAEELAEARSRRRARQGGGVKKMAARSRAAKRR
jgi:hypothetical protein